MASFECVRRSPCGYITRESGEGLAHCIYTTHVYLAGGRDWLTSRDPVRISLTAVICYHGLCCCSQATFDKRRRFWSRELVRYSQHSSMPTTQPFSSSESGRQSGKMRFPSSY